MPKVKYYESTLVRQAINLRKLGDKIEKTIENSRVSESSIKRIQSSILTELARIEEYINDMTRPIVK